MLAERVGSLLSLQSLREDLEVSHRAVSHWLEILERLYYCFRITPYSGSLTRSLKKASKSYLWDWSGITGEGARFENLTAGHLLKLKHALEDQEGYRIGLHYLRDVDKREVDFLVTAEGKPWFALECKISDRAASPALRYFGDRLQIPGSIRSLCRGRKTFWTDRFGLLVAKFLAALPKFPQVIVQPQLFAILGLEVEDQGQGFFYLGQFKGSYGPQSVQNPLMADSPDLETVDRRFFFQTVFFGWVQADEKRVVLP